ncbi:MAG: 16S rRNA (cytosine(1402)-N(4))-methyltransferase RsmH [Prosthecobacter sp.]|nr:16S rRNA (cytosine(1402)-N(4))-methyltransferase RsmH [Prosthecobacter sp.]MDZ4401620.1 16S rRNA (cytosine(1402)-N(4))-methyltransferase RsmH [Prosthecobacter sp.]
MNAPAAIGFPLPRLSHRSSRWRRLPAWPLLVGISRLIGFSQVGGWPWFGATDAMDDLMPWGRGTLVTRPGGGGGGDSLEPAPPESPTRNLPFYHAPVLLAEVVSLLQPAPGKLFFDGTLGGGGHSEALLQHGARVVAMDQDVNALKHATERLKSYAAQFCALRGNFRHFPQIVEETGVSGFDGMLVDIGVSSHQLDDAARGFSFMRDGPLDLRMDTESPRTAADIVNTADEPELTRLFFEYGEEPNARRIARAIIKARAACRIKTTLQFADIVAAASPKRGKRHPATLVFQALRIAVNDELAALHDFLAAAPRWLKPGGRLAVISFHSLEDRIVKQTLQHLSAPFLDRPEWPEPRKNPDCVLKLITRKPVQATPHEIEMNPRARSAVLRVAERLPV